RGRVSTAAKDDLPALVLTYDITSYVPGAGKLSLAMLGSLLHMHGLSD
ncbi:hypothetical protein PanWU01x14_290930, partial [Parasponia andersonii]